ncbi:MAG: hypothetical protein WCI73_01335 [Phycisphaerae bacterium]
MITELESKQQDAEADAAKQAKMLQARTSEIDVKLDRLMTAYVEGAVTLPEFQIAKKIN